MIGRPATEEEMWVIEQGANVVSERLAQLTKELTDMKAGDCMVYEVTDSDTSKAAISFRLIVATTVKGLFNVVEAPYKVFVHKIKEL